jgi:endonuclease/exonuclease/phosphatase family metal-dependent hydrolase
MSQKQSNSVKYNFPEYLFIFRRKRQQLDYMFINQSFAADVKDIDFSRIDYHFSDHAGLLVRFELY